MVLRCIAQKAVRICTFSLLSSIMAFGVVSTAEAKSPTSQLISKHTPTHALAEKLVHRFWDAVKHQHVHAYSNLLAPQFQGMNISGSYTRSQQIHGLKHLTVKHYKISQLVATRHKDALIVTYNFTAKGRHIVSGPCMDIWQRQGEHWKQISHTYVPYP